MVSYGMFEDRSNWYVGGPAICPGRFLAKNIIMFTCAALISEFDIVPTGDVDLTDLDMSRYGLGVVRPKAPVPVRIRRQMDSYLNLYTQPHADMVYAAST